LGRGVCCGWFCGAGPRVVEPPEVGYCGDGRGEDNVIVAVRVKERRVRKCILRIEVSRSDMSVDMEMEIFAV
jgi:hypothetical protein